MTTLSTATGTISSAGIGSGLDVNSIVTQLMAVEKQPLTRLQTAASTMQTELSAFGQLQSLVSGLQDAATPLYDATTFAQANSSSSNPSAVTATTSTGAVAGSYSVSVSSLSSTQSVVTSGAPFADATAAVGTGSLTIRLGTWSANGTVFTPKAGSKASCDSPDASVLLPSSSATVMRKPFAAPELVDCSARRDPFASVTTVALTPALAALILSRIEDSEVSPGPIVIETGFAPDFAAKAEGGVPDQVPSWIVSVPWLSVASDEASALEVTVWPCASCCTVTE